MEESGLKHWSTKKNGLLAAAFMLLYLLVYGALSLRTGLHWDEMYDIDGSATGEYVAAGRWGLALYRLIFGEGAFPLLASVAAGVFISLSLVVQVRMLELEGRFRPLFYGGVYLASIQWAYQVMYSHQTDAVALGLLASTLGVLLISNRRHLGGIALVTFALGTYQSTALHTVCLLLALFLLRSHTPKDLLRPAACLAAALLAYAAVNALSLHLPWTSEQQVAFQQAYQKGMSRWVDYPADGTLREQLHFLYYYGSRFAKMTVKNMLGLAYSGQWVYATILIPLAGLLRKWHREGTRKTFFYKAVAALAIWALPFCLILPSLSDQGARVDMAEPVALALLWGLFLRDLKPGGKLKTILAVSLCFAVVKAAYKTTDIAVNEAYVYQSNLACVREMHTRGCALAESKGMQNATILLLGDIPLDPEVTWTRRKCLTERGYIPPKIFDYYTRYLKLDDIRYATPEEAQKHAEAYKALPDWPAGGSVSVDKDTIIIRVD